MSETETGTETGWDANAEFAAAMGELEPFLGPAEPGETAGQVIDRAKTDAAKAKAARESQSETDYELAKFSQEQAAFELREAKRASAADETEKKVAQLQERRIQVLALTDDPRLRDDPEAQGVVSKRAHQLAVEIDMAIQDLEAAGPWMGFSDEELGTFTHNANIDPHTQTATRGGWFSETSGQIGEALRLLEDASLAHKKILAEHEGDEHSLRVQDAFGELLAAKARVEAIRTEIDRRKGEALLASNDAQEAHKRAAARTLEKDKATKEEIKRSSSMNAEQKALALAQLSVPPDERTGRAGETWKTLLAETLEEVRAESKQNRLKRHVGAGFIVPGDPLYRFLRNGDRLELGVFDRPDGVSYKRNHPLEAKALKLLQGVEDQREHSPLEVLHNPPGYQSWTQ